MTDISNTNQLADDGVYSDDETIRYEIAKHLHGEPQAEVIWHYGSKEAVWKDVAESPAVHRLEKMFIENRERAVTMFVETFETVAIAETNDYANGWNRCRKWVRANLNRMAGLEYSDEYSKMPHDNETSSLNKNQDHRPRKHGNNHITKGV